MPNKIKNSYTWVFLQCFFKFTAHKKWQTLFLAFGWQHIKAVNLERFIPNYSTWKIEDLGRIIDRCGPRLKSFKYSYKWGAELASRSAGKFSQLTTLKLDVPDVVSAEIANSVAALVQNNSLLQHCKIKYLPPDFWSRNIRFPTSLTTLSLMAPTFGDLSGLVSKSNK